MPKAKATVKAKRRNSTAGHKTSRAVGKTASARSVSGVAAKNIRAAQRWLDDSAKVKPWLRKLALDLPKRLAENNGIAKIRGILPPEVADGVRQALDALPADEWEQTGSGSRDDSGYADSVVHRFAITEVERHEVLLGAARLLAKLLPGTLPNFAAAKYTRSDRIAPHDDLVPEEYSQSEVRRLLAAYGKGSLASAAKRWRQEDDTSNADSPRGGAAASTGDAALAEAMQRGDVSAVRKALAAAGAAGSKGPTSSAGATAPYTRWVAAAYYLSKDWKSEFGGEFVDLEGRKRHVPEFNTLVAFQVPRRHEVAAVKAPAGRARLSIFGWWLLEDSGTSKASPRASRASAPRPKALRRKPAASAARKRTKKA